MTDRSKSEPIAPASAEDEDADTNVRPGQPQEKVEDRPTVSTVKPEDYPEDFRVSGRTPD